MLTLQFYTFKFIFIILWFLNLPWGKEQRKQVFPPNTDATTLGLKVKLPLDMTQGTLPCPLAELSLPELEIAGMAILPSERQGWACGSDRVTRQLPSCVTLSKPLHLSESQFAHLKMGNSSCICGSYEDKKDPLGQVLTPAPAHIRSTVLPLMMTVTTNIWSPKVCNQIWRHHLLSVWHRTSCSLLPASPGEGGGPPLAKWETNGASLSP